VVVVVLGLPNQLAGLAGLAEVPLILGRLALEIHHQHPRLKVITVGWEIQLEVQVRVVEVVVALAQWEGMLHQQEILVGLEEMALLPLFQDLLLLMQEEVVVVLE
jgi:hypothetical protein